MPFQRAGEAARKCQAPLPANQTMKHALIIDNCITNQGEIAATTLRRSYERWVFSLSYHPRTSCCVDKQSDFAQPSFHQAAASSGLAMLPALVVCTKN
jgi:hypothetical protein